MGLGVETRAVARQVVPQVELTGSDGPWVKNHQVGVPSLHNPAPFAEPEKAGRHVGHVGHCGFHRGQLPTPKAIGQPLGGVTGAGHAVEVGTGVRATDHDVVVVPGCLAHDPAGRVVVGGPWPQDGLQVVGEHDVQQRVEVPLTALAGNVTDQASLETLVFDRVRIADAVQAPPGQSREHPGVR